MVVLGLGGIAALGSEKIRILLITSLYTSFSRHSPKFPQDKHQCNQRYLFFLPQIYYLVFLSYTGCCSPTKAVTLGLTIEKCELSRKYFCLRIYFAFFEFSNLCQHAKYDFCLFLNVLIFIFFNRIFIE